MSFDVNPTRDLIRLVVNGEPREAHARSLLELVDQLGYRGLKVATALNGDFVAEGQRAATRLRAGDAVEIVAPRQGG